MFSQNIETIPIPKSTSSQKELIATLAESCQSRAELASTEARLNNKVYELFALDADEIDLLEQNLR